MFLGGYTVSYAQPAVEYFYDASGNRTQRKVIPTGMILGEMTETEREQLKTESGEFEFSALPNPTNSLVYIQTEQAFLELDERELRIFDMKGNLIEKRVINSTIEGIDLTNQSSGSYIVKLSGSGGVYTEWRIIKE